MISLEPFDDVVTIQQQLAERSSEPVVLVNVFHVDPAQADALVEAWASDARFLRGQPGFISSQLHRGIAGSGSFLNYAVWETVEAFGTAFAQPDFRARLAAYPDGSRGAPHLMRKMAVAGICTA